MRVLFKKGEKYVSVYWVKIAGNGKVTGWAHNMFLAPWIKPATRNHDYHFFYPVDGNYHISLKYDDDSRHQKMEERFFWDKYVIKYFDDQGVYIETKTSEYCENDEYSKFQPFEEQTRRLDEKEFYFQFALVVGSVERDHSELFYELTHTNPRKDDIIIDLDKNTNGRFNINASIYSKENPKMRSDDLRKASGIDIIKLTTMRQESDLIFLELHVLLFNLNE